MLAEYIIDNGVDSICCREDLHDKGPGLMFYRFGIDVRKTAEEDIETLLQNYFGRSEPVFPRQSPDATECVHLSRPPWCSTPRWLQGAW